LRCLARHARRLFCCMRACITFVTCGAPRVIRGDGAEFCAPSDKRRWDGPPAQYRVSLSQVYQMPARHESRMRRRPLCRAPVHARTCARTQTHARTLWLAHRIRLKELAAWLICCRATHMHACLACLCLADKVSRGVLASVRLGISAFEWYIIGGRIMEGPIAMICETEGPSPSCIPYGGVWLFSTFTVWYVCACVCACVRVCMCACMP